MNDSTVITLQLTVKEFEDLREAQRFRDNFNTSSLQATDRALSDERLLRSFYAISKKLLGVRTSNSAILAIFDELQPLVDDFENF